MSELKISRYALQLLSACFFQIVTYLPVSEIEAPDESLKVIW
ncbi:MAG: hypothetical protein ACREDR_16865 [Blastocatellia bacterium]